MFNLITSLFKASKPTAPMPPHVETLRCGALTPGMYVIHMGSFARLLNWTQQKAQIEYICYTAGNKVIGYDRASAGAQMWVGLDSFRAATLQEVDEYLEP